VIPVTAAASVGSVTTTSHDVTLPGQVDTRTGFAHPHTPTTPDRARLFGWLRQHWELLAYVALASDFVWMRLIDMKVSFWADEAQSAVVYVDGGLSNIYSTDLFSANNHVLFNILSWVTVAALGHDEPNYRIWSVVPSIAATVLLVWWTRRRVGKVAALILSGIFLTAPLLLYESVQARGYGLSLLGMTVVLVAGAEIEEHGPSRRWLVALVAGTVVGPAGQPTCVIGIALVILWLLRRRDLRWSVSKAVVAALIGLAIVVGPLLPTMVRVDARQVQNRANTNVASAKLGPAAIVTGPASIGAYTGQLLFSGTDYQACPGQCYTTARLAKWGWVLFLPALAGIVALWYWRRRGLLGLILCSLLGSFALIIVAQITVHDRFTLFLLPIYALLSAIGAAAAINAVALRGFPRPVLALAGVAALTFGAYRIYEFNQIIHDGPANDFSGLEDAFKGSGVPYAVTNLPPSYNYGLRWYFGKQVVYETPTDLPSVLCRRGATLAFIQGVLPLTATELRCLRRRHPSAEDFPGGGATLLRLWLVRAPGQPAFTLRVAAPPGA
jgi:4-amino-4-deoxy-L-arabinose transferase-like glycosyltransferase